MPEGPTESTSYSREKLLLGESCGLSMPLPASAGACGGGTTGSASGTDVSGAGIVASLLGSLLEGVASAAASGRHMYGPVPPVDDGLATTRSDTNGSTTLGKRANGSVGSVADLSATLSC